MRDDVPGLVLPTCSQAVAGSHHATAPDLIYNFPMPDQRPDAPINPPRSDPSIPFIPLDRITAVAPPAGGRPPAPAAPPPPIPTSQISDFHIGEEFGTAKRNLPPARIVLICIAAIAVIIGLVAFKQRPKPQGAGTINLVSAVEVPGQDIILAAITMTLRNSTQRPLWIKTIKAQLTTAEGKILDDDAASAVDLDRYYQAFPLLKDGAEPSLAPETKLLPGAEQRGTIIVSYKLTKEEFDRRTSLAVTIQPYDQPLPVILK